jgi:hypothetical protein
VQQRQQLSEQQLRQRQQKRQRQRRQQLQLKLPPLQLLRLLLLLLKPAARRSRQARQTKGNGLSAKQQQAWRLSLETCHLLQVLSVLLALRILLPTQLQLLLSCKSSCMDCRRLLPCQRAVFVPLS